MESFAGLYKLSAKTLFRMISQGTTYKGRYAGASRYEILALIHLSHLADSSGRVEKFRPMEFISILDCSRREAFSLLHTLSDKGYVRVTPSDWKCCYDIKILDNDYSVENKERYLNTNQRFLEAGSVYYERFLDLSLTSMRLLLFLLFNYSMDYGYHASYASIMRSLGIKHKWVINKCLEELDPLLSYDESFYTVRSDLKRGYKYGYLNIAGGNDLFAFKEGIRNGQETYFKRHIRHMAADLGCVIDGGLSGRDALLTKAFGIMQNFVSKLKPTSRIYDILRHCICKDGILDDLTLYHLSAELSSAI